ncbi:DUF5662 family protein [Carnobacterium viridans]|uniref:Uncharacterized protein n=1 Tax=Carnobacterium viridans TaxID=174587 RepID=A0A1H1BRK4_9LACT|nr:DUF5662 family protein [Carnobacterium viridans]UDE95680.1 DUF5662 family protein [Carnobacterium viridans]SDQ54523.1 hypothetical protein SAMN04487752_2706 [Carnobacterium viridans]
MDFAEERCKTDTVKHINLVRKHLYSVIDELDKRAKVHDDSKLKSPELETFVKFTPKLAGSTYGSEEYKKNLEGMQVALKHHYEVNSHHPEHYENGIKGMDLLDVIEMFCDWKAATERHEDGDINKSIEINQKRFKYSDDLKNIFKNTVNVLN